MSLLHAHFSEIDTQISAFARAIALPIRVFILRMIAENGNCLTKQAVYASNLNAKTINKHIQELRGLGIIKVRNVRAEATYCIDEKLFEQMSVNFSHFFDNNLLLPPMPTGISATAEDGPQTKPDLSHYPHFGAYIKEHRLELNLSQATLAEKIVIDRALLSRIECGKKALNAQQLPLLAKALYLSLDDTQHAFAQLPPPN
ncbi:helix-turn-helix domain-containing protein [Mucilaginibacter psychrotolerans]|nr:helix-turn-helix domain-containing protein [Mucilaginibacter psychrotolerans]